MRETAGLLEGFLGSGVGGVLLVGGRYLQGRELGSWLACREAVLAAFVGVFGRGGRLPVSYETQVVEARNPPAGPDEMKPPHPASIGERGDEP